MKFHVRLRALSQLAENIGAVFVALVIAHVVKFRRLAAQQSAFWLAKFNESLVL